MVSKEKCAFLRKGGECLLHRGQCLCGLLTHYCDDGVRRVTPHPKQVKFSWNKAYDLRTVEGRMRFAAHHSSGGVVYSQCGKKKRYRTEYRAKEIARRRERSSGVLLRVYPCNFCAGFHLTKKIENGAA